MEDISPIRTAQVHLVHFGFRKQLKSVCNNIVFTDVHVSSKFENLAFAVRLNYIYIVLFLTVICLIV
jgi:hypothetical protein